MCFSKGTVVRCIMILAVIVITSVIFVKSFENISTSHSYSDAIAEAISSDNADYIEKGNLEVTIRKWAHVIEYAVLGIAVMCLLLNVHKAFNKPFFGVASFYVLAVAVVDEHIQSFSDRTSSTDDIILDFVGALLGFAFTFGVYLLISFIKNKRCTKTT